jgi:hypothetical protein
MLTARADGAGFWVDASLGLSLRFSCARRPQYPRPSLSATEIPSATAETYSVVTPSYGFNCPK